jgi:hypothetical protein
MANKHGVQSPQSIPRRNKSLLNIAALPREDYFGYREKDVAFYDIGYPWFWQTIPSKQEVQLYSNLPLDIVRSIFDMAMWEYPKPVHLLLVSQEVKSWSVGENACSMLFISEFGSLRIEPLLYQHIYLPDRRRLGLLYRTYSERKKRLRQHDNSTERRYISLRGTKSVILYTYPFTTIPMFGEMTGLERIEFGYYAKPFIFDSFCLSGKTPSASTTNEAQEDTYYYKNIRHLSLYGASLTPSTTFCHRAFRDITHLDMYFSEHVAWETLRHLQSLTHLALDMVECCLQSQLLSAPVLESWVSSIVTACPPTVQALIICCIDAHNESFDLLDFIRSGSELGTTDGGGKTRIPSSVASNPKDYHRIPLHNLQYLSRLALGKVDRRVVCGSTTELHDNHTFRNGVVYITYREQGRRFGHDGTRWYEAERIIKRRLL